MVWLLDVVLESLSANVPCLSSCDALKQNVICRVFLLQANEAGGCVVLQTVPESSVRGPKPAM
jgi:hypothetical protein